VPLIAREFESVAPGSRTSFGKISSDWALASERTAKQYLQSVGQAVEEVESVEVEPAFELTE
jgi:hypothetical protein